MPLTSGRDVQRSAIATVYGGAMDLLLFSRNPKSFLSTLRRKVIYRVKAAAVLVIAVAVGISIQKGIPS